MRSFTQFAGLRYLALAAMLLLSFAPSVSRLLAAPGIGSGWVQLCTMNGLEQVWLDQTPVPAPEHPSDGDCGYCPLLGAMLGAALLLLLLPQDRRRELRQWPRPSRAGGRCDSGSLGARGPPSMDRVEIAA